jgi:hypothetical protein
VVEAEQRRGSARLPLKANDWNAMKLELKEGSITLELNGVIVYERPLEAANNRQFGLYHDKGATDRQVRQVVLRGDWPESLSSRLEDLFATRHATDATPADRRARYELVGPEYLCQEAGPLLDRVQGLPDEARHEALAAWVLPGPDLPGFRPQGEFLASAADDLDTLGARFRAPDLELVKLARRLGKLVDLARRVEKADVVVDYDKRSRDAFNVLLALARDDEATASALLKTQSELAGRFELEAPVWQRWPELAAASEAMEHAGARAAALDLLDVLNKQDMKAIGLDWQVRIRAARTRGEVLKAPDSEQTALGRTPREKIGWVVVTHSSA